MFDSGKTKISNHLRGGFRGGLCLMYTNVAHFHHNHQNMFMIVVHIHHKQSDLENGNLPWDVIFLMITYFGFRRTNW